MGTEKTTNASNHRLEDLDLAVCIEPSAAQTLPARSVAPIAVLLDQCCDSLLEVS